MRQLLGLPRSNCSFTSSIIPIYPFYLKEFKRPGKMYFSKALLLALGAFVESGCASWNLKSFDNLVAFGDRYRMAIITFRAAAINHVIVSLMRAGWDGISNMAQLLHQEPHYLPQTALREGE